MRTGLTILILAAGLLLTTSWAADKPADERPAKAKAGSAPLPEKAANSEFRGKVIGISLQGIEYGSYMVNAAVRKLGNREFLVGEWPEFPDQKAFHGLVSWVPIDQITHIMEFDSVEEVLKSTEAQEEAGGRKPGSSFPSPSLKTR